MCKFFLYNPSLNLHYDNSAVMQFLLAHRVYFCVVNVWSLRITAQMSDINR